MFSQAENACILIVFFPGVRMPLLIIENHCNPIFLPEGWRDVKSRRSRLRSCHPNEPGKPRCRPIRRHRDGLAITGSRRVRDPSPSGTNRTDSVHAEIRILFPYGIPRSRTLRNARRGSSTSLYYDRQGCSPRRGIYGLATRRFRYRLYNTPTRK